MDVQIRQAVASDSAALSVLSTEVWLDTYATAGISAAFVRHVRRAYSAAAINRAIAGSQSPIFLCHGKGLLLGYARLGLADSALAMHGTAELVTLYVRRHHHRQGIGTALLQTLCAAAGDMGHRGICATVLHSNRRALRFYARHGMEPVGTWTLRFEGIDAPNVIVAKPLFQDRRE